MLISSWYLSSNKQCPVLHDDGYRGFLIEWTIGSMIDCQWTTRSRSFGFSLSYPFGIFVDPIHIYNTPSKFRWAWIFSTKTLYYHCLSVWLVGKYCETYILRLIYNTTIYLKCTFTEVKAGLNNILTCL